ncbi:MAG: transglycosylase domain-containing protein [Sphingobacteriales bacterium]|nr:transglycosylase domain-containing protein [Sphingobacteriales bacterium]
MTQTRILSSLNNQPEPNKNNNNGKNSRQSGKKTSFGWRLLRFLGSLFLISAFLLISFYFMVRQGMFGELPNYADLRAIKTPTASTIYANEGQVLGRFYYQNRQIISYNDIPAFVIQALVATEDARFYQHQGVDARSLFRVLIRSILLGDESGGGGSTIGQQLIKSLYLGNRTVC